MPVGIGKDVGVHPLQIGMFRIEAQQMCTHFFSLFIILLAHALAYQHGTDVDVIRKLLIQFSQFIQHILVLKVDLI